MQTTKAAWTKMSRTMGEYSSTECHGCGGDQAKSYSVRRTTRMWGGNEYTGKEAPHKQETPPDLPQPLVGSRARPAQV